jgi:hypothetical protein
MVVVRSQRWLPDPPWRGSRAVAGRVFESEIAIGQHRNNKPTDEPAPASPPESKWSEQAAASSEAMRGVSCRAQSPAFRQCAVISQWSRWRKAQSAWPKAGAGRGLRSKPALPVISRSQGGHNQAHISHRLKDAHARDFGSWRTRSSFILRSGEVGYFVQNRVPRVSSAGPSRRATRPVKGAPFVINSQSPVRGNGGHAVRLAGPARIESDGYSATGSCRVCFCHHNLR